jgi:hypothetical protein
MIDSLVLPSAPPVVRGSTATVAARRGPAVALLVLGVVLVVGPIAGGLFAKVAAGQQLIDNFEPHMQADALARYDTDLGVLRRGAAGVDAVYRQQAIATGRFPLLDEYRAKSTAIDARATALLDRINAAEPDYRKVNAIGGFDRVPFLVVLVGLVAVYGGVVALAGTNRSRRRSAVVLVLVAAAAITAYPFLSNLPRGGRAGGRMLDALAPVMTAGQVRQLQRDFVVDVQAVGQLDTAFHDVPAPGPSRDDIAALDTGWPGVSSDLATLVGTINDNLGNYHALVELDDLAPLSTLPWVLVGIGVVSAGLAIAARPRRGRALL